MNLLQFRVPDRARRVLYRICVLQVTGEDHELGDAVEYRAVITNGPPGLDSSANVCARGLS